MADYVPMVFQSFISTFFSVLYNNLIEEMNDPIFVKDYIEHQQLSMMDISDIIKKFNTTVAFDELANGEVIDQTVEVYIEIAEKCAKFQKEAAALLEKHFPGKYPDYFLNSLQLIKPLRQEIELLQQLNDQLMNENEQYELEIEQLATEKQKVDAQLATIKKSVVREEKAAKKVEAELLTVQQALADKESELEQTADVIQQKNIELLELNKKLKEIQNASNVTVQELEKKYNALQKKYDEREQATHHTSTPQLTAYDELLTERDSLAKKLEALKLHVKELQREMEQYDGNEQKLQKEIQMLQKRLQQQKIVASKSTDDNSSTSSTIMKKIEERANMSVMKLRTELEKYLRENKQLKQMIQDNNPSAGDHSFAEIKKLQQQIKELKEANREKEEQIEFYKSSASSFGKQLNALRQRLKR